MEAIEEARRTGFLMWEWNDWRGTDPETTARLFESVHTLESAHIIIGGGAHFDALGLLLPGNPGLVKVVIQVIDPREHARCNAVLRTWAAARPQKLRVLKVYDVDWEEETCAAVAENMPDIVDLCIHGLPSWGTMMALVAPMRNLREIFATMCTRADDDIRNHAYARVIEDHPVLESAYFVGEFHAWAPRDPLTPGPPTDINHVIRKQGVFSKHGSYFEAGNNWRRRTTPFDALVPWPYFKIAFVGDSPELGLRSDLFPSFTDDRILYDATASRAWDVDKLVSFLARARPRASPPCYARAPRASYDPALDAVFKCPRPDAPSPANAWPEGGNIFVADLRAIADPDLGLYAGVMVIVDLSIELTPKKFDLKCERLRRLCRGKVTALVDGSPPGHATPPAVLQRRRAAYTRALTAHARTAGPVYLLDTADGRSGFFAAFSAVHMKDRVPFRWGMAAALLARADADGQAVLLADEWADLLDACGIDAADSPAVLAAASRAGAFRGVSTGGAVLLLRENERVWPFFVRGAPCAMHALSARGLFASREIRARFARGRVTAEMVAALYEATLLARDRKGAAYRLPCADELAHLLVVAGIIARGADGFVLYEARA